MKIAYIGNKPSVEGRFLAKFLVDDGCWEWTEGRFDDRNGENGYGQFWHNGQSIQAHRFSWEMFNRSSILSGVEVCHSCDRPSCVNPAHLFLGTTKDNAQDRESKRRGGNSSKTHCPQGHEYSAENTYVYPSGAGRKCRICVRENNRAADFRRRQARKGLI